MVFFVSLGADNKLGWQAQQKWYFPAHKHDKRIKSTKYDFLKILQKEKKFNCLYHNLYNYSNMLKVKNNKKGDLLSISIMKNITN